MARKSKVHGCRDHFWSTTVGIFGTKSGGKYVWKVKLLQGKSICIGVINNTKCKHDRYQWLKHFKIYSKNGMKQPG